MNNRNLDTESLNTLIRAVNTYLDELNKNKQIITNAANACDMAMGSDAIAKKHIDRLNSALESLEATAHLASAVATELTNDLIHANSVEENA